MEVGITAGQGIEALRARFNSSSALTVPNVEALRDVLTTLRAQLVNDDDDAAPRQSFSSSFDAA